MSARDRILNRVDEATRETKDAIAKARAEARAKGVPFDLKKFHADRAKAVSKQRDETKFGSSWKGKGGRLGSEDLRRKIAGSKGRSARGTETAEDIARKEKKRAEAVESGLNPETGQREVEMTGHQRGGRKNSINSRLAKGPSKPMNLPDHNESDYTDDEVIKLIMTESYLSLFGFLSEKNQEKVDEGIITNFLQGFKNKKQSSDTFKSPEDHGETVKNKILNSPKHKAQQKEVSDKMGRAEKYANRSHLDQDPEDPYDEKNVTRDKDTYREAGYTNQRDDKGRETGKTTEHGSGINYGRKRVSLSDKSEAQSDLEKFRDTKKGLESNTDIEKNSAADRRDIRLSKQKSLRRRVSGPLGSIRRAISNVMKKR